MKNMKRKMFVIIPLFVLTITSMVYAATSITALTQTVTSGDTIQAAWYNAVNTMIGWSHTSWGRCTYNWTKILCNSAAPAAASSGVGYDCDSDADSSGRIRSSCVNITNWKACWLGSWNIYNDHNTDWGCLAGNWWDITPADFAWCSLSVYGGHSYMKCFNKNWRICDANTAYSIVGSTLYWTCKASSTGQSVN